MRKFVYAALLALGLVLGWFGIWSWLMAADVTRVKASIDHHYQQLRTVNRTMSLAADSVAASGFPFAFEITVTRATLSMVDGDETFAVSIPALTMKATDSGQGTYRVTLPETIEALYAKNGQAPEQYRATMNSIPKLNVSAADAGKPCGPLVGRACADVASDAALVSFAVGLPSNITLRMQLGEKTRDARFDLPAIDVPIYQTIPSDLSRSLQLFVGVLREALVFNTPGNEVPK
jgi:hypothetical protein